MWEGSEVVGGRRKSARISALNEVKRNNEFSKSGDNVVGENGQNQAHVTARAAASAAKRGRKRKRLKDVGLSSQQVPLSLPCSYMYICVCARAYINWTSSLSWDADLSFRVLTITCSFSV